jgi:uncharacterized phage-like protein YoqJ
MLCTKRILYDIIDSIHSEEAYCMVLPNKIESVCFTGHRVLTPSEERMISSKLHRILPILIEKYGLTSCYAGGALGLDTLAALAVLETRDSYPVLKLNLILPCQGQEKTWNQQQKEAYNDIKEKADRVRVLSPTFYNGCMQARNRELLRSADLCIAYLRPGTSGGGSLNTVLQAAKLGVPVINLADDESEYLI